LCGPCKEETHRAKMFSAHDVVHISQKATERGARCSAHGERAAMFCTTSRALLCMRCFGEASLETRLHCVDVDIAYEQARKRFDKTMTAIS